MSEKDKQQELFSEFEEPKRLFGTPHGVLARPLSITLSIERLVFISIAIIMALIIVYAFGIEQGKRTEKKEVRYLRELLAARESVSLPRRSDPSAAMIAQDLRPSVTPPAEKAKNVSPASIQASAKETSAQNAARPYSVIVSTFKSRAFAANEVASLKRDGYNAYIVDRGTYAEVCIGRYADVGDATRLKRTLRSRFPDCVVRKN